MSEMRYGLEGRVAMVTGGSRGIGLELARELLRQEAKVVICARKQEGLDAALEDLGGGDSVLAVLAHIAREDQVENLIQKAIDKFGHIDILINNVGMNLLTASLAGADSATWQKIIDTNLNGTYFCSRAAARRMKERNLGRIVNVSTVAAARATPGMGIYGVAKAGVEMLTRTLAAELAADNITVNAVAPGMVRTGFSRPFWSDPELQAGIVATIPLGRLAEPVDVVHPVLFLCSDAAGYITGQVLRVDGGTTAR